MKIKELVEKLNKLDPELLVLVNGYEDGYDDIDCLRAVDVKKEGQRAEWEGEYTPVDAKETDSTLAVLLASNRRR